MIRSSQASLIPHDSRRRPLRCRRLKHTRTFAHVTTAAALFVVGAPQAQFSDLRFNMEEQDTNVDVEMGNEDDDNPKNNDIEEVEPGSKRRKKSDVGGLKFKLSDVVLRAGLVVAEELKTSWWLLL
ncbi:galactose oxidase/kelch repeat superfamily protein [Striga asiatica]|uniref:Galactose oxidase/kelch repeat superfamily protein n=1 Tax=Striga asiatica TaxID=4170 RepID=A0A5A7Q661_STRAF|nr:galactose oxidase/kelch repeat superfamily protein [Striga asiatica]